MALIPLWLFDIDAERTSLPEPGDVIFFVPAKMHIYRNSCQVKTKVHHIVTVTSA